VEVLVLLTYVCPVLSPILCAHCLRESSNWKAYTDHRQTMHGLYYVSTSGLLSPYTLLPITSRLMFELGQKHLLRKDKAKGPVICHLCNGFVNCSSKKIKLHYSLNHNLHVQVNIRYPPPRDSLGTSNVHPPPYSTPLQQCWPPRGSYQVYNGTLPDQQPPGGQS
jgi:hypothetical protein